jgi:hydroxymethylbilane synthase
MAALRQLRLGTRGSQLALWQAHAVADRIAQEGGPECRIVTIKTSGDRLAEAPLSEIGGKRLFVKEIEDALLRHEIDLAVHSSKDMPAVLPEGLMIAAVLPREDPLDAVVLPSRIPFAPRIHKSRSATGPALDTGNRVPSTMCSLEDLIAALGEHPILGTGSVRRVAQLTRLMPGARFANIRGNLDTRLRKLEAGENDALVLAAAGLRRLGFASRIALTLPAPACVPAPGQGIVAIQTCADDEEVGRAVARIDDPISGAALTAERALVAALGGGCQTPIGALASPIDDDTLELVAAVVALDGSRAIHGRARGPRRDAAALGERVAAEILAEGADEILAQVQMSQQTTIASTRSAAMTNGVDD